MQGAWKLTLPNWRRGKWKDWIRAEAENRIKNVKGGVGGALADPTPPTINRLPKPKPDASSRAKSIGGLLVAFVTALFVMLTAWWDHFSDWFWGLFFMKYFKPKSLTWWSGILSIAMGLVASCQ